MSGKRNMTLEYDEKTEAVLEELKDFFGVKSKAEVIRRALAVTRSTTRLADDHHVVTITEPKTNDRVKLGL